MQFCEFRKDKQEQWEIPVTNSEACLSRQMVYKIRVLSLYLFKLYQASVQHVLLHVNELKIASIFIKFL